MTVAVRVSFTIDAEAMERIDLFAKEHGVDRNRAILELLEQGYLRLQGTEMATPNEKRAFEEYERLRTSIGDVRSSVEALREEVRLIRHLLDRDPGIREGAYPYQKRSWWEFGRKS